MLHSCDYLVWLRATLMWLPLQSSKINVVTDKGKKWKLCLSASWTHGLEHLNGIQWSMGQISLRTPFYSYFEKFFNGVCHMSQVILLYFCDYLYKVSIKINVATDEGNNRNEIWHWTKRWNWSSRVRCIYIIYSKRWRGTICDIEWWNAKYHLYFCVVF